MAERGQMTGAVLDAPLTFDNAISREAATTKQLAVPVAGHADILIVSDFEAGDMLTMTLSFRAPHADSSHKPPRLPAHWHRQSRRCGARRHAWRVAADIGKTAGSEPCARILVINAGSSSIKISVFETAADRSFHLGPHGERSKPSRVRHGLLVRERQ